MSQPDTLALPRAEPSPMLQLTALAIVLTLLATGWALADTRVVDGVPVWMKPLKFSLSLILLFGTLALVETRLSLPVRTGRVARATAAVMTAAYVAEMGYIFWRAARAEPSHFNLDGAFARLMYEVVMFGGAVALVAGVGVYGWLALRDRQAEFGPALRRGVGWGFLLSFVLTFVTASALGGMGRHVGLHPENGAVIPLLGWSGVVGDLRPSHFAALHTMQVLPLLGLWLDRTGRSARYMIAASVAWAALTLVLFAQALMGYPMIPLG